MLAVPSAPFDSPQHLFEIKWDGLRCLVFLDGATRLQSRNLKDVTFQYPELSSIHSDLRLDGTILDGEIILLENGRPSFPRLQKRMHARTARAIQEGAKESPVIYVVFDLLYYKGNSLLKTPLWKRREILSQNIAPNPHLIISDAVPERGRSFFMEVTKLGLEGMIGKDRNSFYLPGRRSSGWKKCRVTKSEHFVICGYTTNPEGRGDLSALALGAYGENDLFSFGLVGTGLSQAEIDFLLELLHPLRTLKPPFSHPVEAVLRKAHWVRPELVCEVEYLEVTRDLHLRHPVYRGLRPEIPPSACRAEKVLGTSTKF